MPRRKDPQSCKSQLSAWTSMIFRTAIILHLTDINGGESLADSQYRMLAVIGHMQNITLPCSVNPAADAVDEMVEWSRSDLNPRFVHLRRSGEDHLFDQNPSYKGRTSVSTDRLKTGDASLQLTKVRLSDDGTYRCFIPRLNTDLSVELVVEADIKITKVSTGILECKSEGWHPEPEVFWLDSEQKLLSAGPKEVFRGPDDLYTLSSRLTLEKGHGSNFICRVQQNNQHREAKMHVPDDFFMDSSPSARSVVGGLIAGLMFLIVVSFLIWKWRKNKMGPKKSCEDGESQSGREDSRCSSSKDPEKESLMKKEEECKAGSEAETVTHSEPFDSNIKIPNQSLMDSSGQQQQLKKGEEVKNDTDKKEDTKKTQTAEDETAGKSTSEEERKQSTEGQNNPEVQEKDGDREKTGTTNKETVELPDKNENQPNPTEEQTEREQDHEEEDNKPKSNTQSSHPENNGTNQEPSGSTEQANIEENQSGNNSPTDDHSEDRDQHGNSATSSAATTGLKHQNNDGNGERTDSDKGTSHHDETEGGGGKTGKGDTEKDSEPEYNTKSSLLKEEEDSKSKSNTPENNGTNQEPSGSTDQANTEKKQSGNNSETDEHSKGGDQPGNLTVSRDATTGLKHQNNDDNGVKTETTDDETAGKSTSEEEGKQSTEGQNNPEVQEKDGDGKKTGNTNNQTAEPLDKNENQPNPAEEKTERGQDHQEEDSKPKSNTQSSHPENNGTNQEPSGSTEQLNIKKKQSGNNLQTDEGPEGGDQHGNSAVSRDATSGLKHQNNDDNGAKTETTNNETTPATNKGTSHHDEAEGGGGKTGQGDTEKDSKPEYDTKSSLLKENDTNHEKPDSNAKGETE